jgi:molybdopterin biosynthesis enzyme MoaB
LLRDDVERIREQLKRWIATPDIDAIISTGGRGPGAT